MPRNYELDRLRAEQQAAYERKQEAYQRYDEAKQRTQQRVRDDNNYHIDYLRRDADSEHQAMIDCFEQASMAYESGDKATASMYSSEGHEHKDRRNDLNAEVSALVQEIRDAKAYAEATAPKVDQSAFYAAKERFEQAKEWHQRAEAEFKREKSERDRLKSEFNRLQAEFLRAKEAFQSKRDEVRAEREARRNELRNGTYRGTYMGLPAVIKVSDAGNSDQVQVFYGGKGRPDGDGHSHVNIVKDELRYWRENGTVIFDRNDGVNDL